MNQPNELIRDLYLRMYSFLLDYANVSLENHALAEEAVQETFRIACQKADDLNRCVHPGGWIVNTLKNVISNTRKSREAANRLLLGYVATHGNHLSCSEDHIRIEILYENIAETEELKLLKELAIDGYSYLEMAQRRGISVSTCRKRVQRAKEILRKKIAE